ncbi:MAG: Ig-like domain-containing protein [Pseudomonadota bacterium]|nr:Ig-like domain-containing protein [Pseudomonadota bacterium]
MARDRFLSLRALAGIVCALVLVASALTVMSITPAGNARNVPRSTAITIQFDALLTPASVTATSFLVWRQMVGLAAGTTAFFNGNQTLTLSMQWEPRSVAFADGRKLHTGL